jgi:N-acetylmuramoyl-L-alanine amidase
MVGVVAALAAWLAAAPPLDSLTVASSRGVREVAVRSERGMPAVAEPDLAGVLSVTLDTLVGGTAHLRVAGERFDFVLDATYFRFGDRILGLAGPPYLARDTLYVPLQWLVEYLPRLMPDRFRYDPERARLDELPPGPADSADAVAAAARAARVPPPALPETRRRAPSSASGLRWAHVVAIDAGHGGPDVGMLGPLVGKKYLREKDVTLAVAKDLAAELRRRGVGVAMTRTTDTLISLEDRGRIARAHGADLFVSIHVNAANPRWRHAARVRGFETYFLAEARTEDARRVARMENESMRFEKTGDAGGDPMRFILNDLLQNEHLRESSRLASTVERGLGQALPGEGRGVKQAGFAVLATSYMPAVLVELGFGTNTTEARFLTSRSGQRRLAKAIADSIIRYLQDYEGRLPVAASEGAE